LISICHCKQVDRPLSLLDGQIAPIGRAHAQAIATRDVRRFEESGVALIDPYDS